MRVPSHTHPPIRVRLSLWPQPAWRVPVCVCVVPIHTQTSVQGLQADAKLQALRGMAASAAASAQGLASRQAECLTSV